MANLNKVHLIGRLTRDTEIRMAASGMKIAQVGFAVSNRKKNSNTGQWENEPCYLDCTAFGKTADVIEQYLSKGSQAYIEGHLVFEQWEDKNGGGKRSKVKVIIDHVQLLGARNNQQDRGEQHDTQPHDQPQYADPPLVGQSDENIPF